jgi:hypothetical protein
MAASSEPDFLEFAHDVPEVDFLEFVHDVPETDSRDCLAELRGPDFLDFLDARSQPGDPGNEPDCDFLDFLDARSEPVDPSSEPGCDFLDFLGDMGTEGDNGIDSDLLEVTMASLGVAVGVQNDNDAPADSEGDSNNLDGLYLVPVVRARPRGHEEEKDSLRFVLQAKRVHFGTLSGFILHCLHVFVVFNGSSEFVHWFIWAFLVVVR